MSVSEVPALSGSEIAFTLTVCIFLLLLVVVWGLFIARRRQRVFAESVALEQLSELNTRVRQSVARYPSIRRALRTEVNSKAKFDRIDLPALMASNILESEQCFQQEIDLRIESGRFFNAYEEDINALANKWLGKSTHPRVSDKQLAAIERKTFDRRQLASPLPKAKIGITVSYTSPKGKNSYSRRLLWNFSQLQAGLREAQEIRTKQSTQEHLRQRQPILMTASLRLTILRRDGSRCQMCGGSAANGATLHIDHITPVSRGGKTVLENLQTLCESCNLGKSNRFID